MTATPTPLRERCKALVAKWRGPLHGQSSRVGEGARRAYRQCADKLDAALSARDEAGAVAYDRELVADMLGELVYDEGYGMKSRSAYTVEAIEEQVRLLREADNAEAARVGTVSIATPPASGKAGAVGKLQAFKDYVHQRLDAMGVPVDPESPHKAAGCRIGGRLDYVEANLATPAGSGAWTVDRLTVEVEKRLCAVLGREWSAAGISIETLLADVARRLAAVAPAGMVLVPRKLTSAMIRAFGDAPSHFDEREELQLAWDAMLAAAPTPPATAGQE